LLPESDVRRLEQFGAEIHKRYSANLIREKHIPNGATEAAFDGNPDTFWSAPVGSHQALLEADFFQPVTFDHSLAMEWLNDGQHIQHYRVEAWDGKSWKTLAEGHPIGHKRIDSFAAVTTSRVRLRILSSSAQAHIREFQVYDTGP
jgi:alpha-L-fucosidase